MSAPQASRTIVRGADVAYRRAGEGDPVLYLHGLDLADRWLPLHEHLATAADVIAPDQPGFGGSALPEWLEDFTDLVLHYAELADDLELGRFHLVGHSFGGWLAAEIAVFYPERLRSLTLIAPLGLRVPGHTPTDVFRLPPERFAELSYNGRQADYAAVLRADDPEMFFQAYADRTGLAKVAWNPRYDRRLDRRLGRVRAPTLVLGAEQDAILPRAHVNRYSELIAGARTVIVSDERSPSGHGLVLEEPSAVAREITTMWKGQ